MVIAVAVAAEEAAAEEVEAAITAAQERWQQ